MAMKAKGPAESTLESLDRIFGQEYFESGRLVITVARDLPGVMNVARKLQTRIMDQYGATVEVIMEYVKHTLWMKLHEATQAMGVQKGEEDEAAAVTHIPEGIRQHPYKRDHMPTLEVLLLWNDKTGATKGYCLSTTAYPAVPADADIDRIFTEVQPFFAKRWVTVQLKLAAPIRGEFEDEDCHDAEKTSHDACVGAGALVTILACHALGHALEGDGVSRKAEHVTECQPLSFKGVSDDAGVAKICFLPAEVNKLQIIETDAFHGYDGSLPMSKLNSVDKGPTIVPIELTPKALAGLVVHVFAMPATMPADENGIIDWASEERDMLAAASCDVTPLKDGARTLPATATREEDGVLELNGLPEGCVTMVIGCPGYASEEKTMMLLVGSNEFYVPLRAA